jgi:hypothetical protein
MIMALAPYHRAKCMGYEIRWLSGTALQVGGIVPSQGGWCSENSMRKVLPDCKGCDLTEAEHDGNAAHGNVYE